MVNLKSLTNFWKSKNFIGCDVGATSLKIVKLRKQNGNVVLEQKGLLNVSDTLQKGERARQIRDFLEAGGFVLDGFVSANIEDLTLFIRKMDLPKMPERDLLTAIRWNFREYVDGSIDDYIVSYLPIEGAPSMEKMPISAFCISKRAVEMREAFLKEAGLKPAAIEPDAMALVSVFNYNTNWKMGECYAVIDLGDSVSNFVVVGNGTLMFSRPLGGLSGRKLAELLGTEDNNQAVVSNYISQLVVDVQRSIDAFCLMYKKEKLDKIFLCGGGVYLSEVMSRFSSGLGVGVEILNPFANVDCPEEIKKMKEAPLYAVAVGLALPRE